VLTAYWGQVRLPARRARITGIVASGHGRYSQSTSMVALAGI
jgi:hypothetical protein